MTDGLTEEPMLRLFLLLLSFSDSLFRLKISAIKPSEQAFEISLKAHKTIDLTTTRPTNLFVQKHTKQSISQPQDRQIYFRRRIVSK